MGIWYRTGTVSVANGSTAVTGALTAWTAQVKPGDGITFNGGAKWYEIASVESNTGLTLVTAFQETTVSGGVYAIDRRSPYRALNTTLSTQIGELLEKQTSVLQG